MLCFRCQRRLDFLQEGRRPRYECGKIESSTCGCYMYKPVKPIITGIHKDDPRSDFRYGAAILAPRERAIRVPEMLLKLKEYEDGNLLYWDILPEE